MGSFRSKVVAAADLWEEEVKWTNPRGRYGKRGGQDRFKTSVWVSVLNDLVNPGGRKPDWVWGSKEAGNSDWIVALEEALVSQLDVLQILWDGLEIKICDLVGPN